MESDPPILDDAWVLARRGSRNALNAAVPYAMMVEPERTRGGMVEDVATIFLVNRECPLRCVMCDLWKNTTAEPVAEGAVPEQIRYALSRLPPARHVKLYNAGSFFDGGAIPRADWPKIAALIRPFGSVIVECHPRLVDGRCLEFAGMIDGEMEMAMGLETVDPAVLPRLNKRMTVEDFSRAARFLVANGIHVRAFILLRAPFHDEVEGVFWAKRSIEWAFDEGVECCVVIPTRGGNGAMEALAARGLFAPPTLDSLVEAVEHGIRLHRGRVFADLWDVERLASAGGDKAEMIARLHRMNLTQEAP